MSELLSIEPRLTSAIALTVTPAEAGVQKKYH